MKIHLSLFFAGALFAGMLTSADFVLAASADDKAPLRDHSVDAMMIKNAGWAGVLPPTRGQGAPAGAQAPFVNPTYPQPQSTGSLAGLVTRDSLDRQGRIYDLKGTVKVAVKEGAKWENAKHGQPVSQGTILLTQKESSASVAFDRNYMNVVHVPENSRVIFKTIEPTEMVVEDGTLYNLFDKLPKDSGWKVSTPTAVASVRGTHFVVRYLSSTGEFITATLNVPDDGHSSLVEVLDVKDDGSTGEGSGVPEGKQIELKAGQAPSPDLLEEIDEYWLNQILEVLEKLAELRRGQRLPPTSGEFFEPGSFDTGGADTVGGGPDNTLDPLDTGGMAGEPEPELPSSEDDYRSEYPPLEEGNGNEPPYEGPPGGGEEGGEEGCGNECV